MQCNPTEAANVTESGAVPAAPRTERPTRSREVLVMDSDPELRVFLNKALFAGNVSYTSVTSPGEALACLRKNVYGLLIVGHAAYLSLG